MTAWFFAGFVALVLLPGYAGLLALYLCVTAFSEHASRRMVTTATAVLAVPGILLVVASFAGTFEPTPSWDWPEALRPFPFVAASIWGALLLPRLAFTSLAPGTVEGSGNAGIAPAAV